MPPRLLLVDADRVGQLALQNVVISLGGEGVSAESAEMACARLRTEPFDLCLLDMNLPGGGWEQVIRLGQTCQQWTPVIALAGRRKTAEVVAAFTAGASDFLPRPFNHDLAVEILGRVLEEKTGGTTSERTSGACLIGSNLGIEMVRARIDQAADFSANVLIQGEDGTGKEIVARLIHACGARSTDPFVVVRPDPRASAKGGTDPFGFTVVRGTDESPTSNGGTLFINDVAALPSDAQEDLLDLIKESRKSASSAEQDLRIVAATSHDMKNAMREGFSTELYHLLNVIPIEIPPLCERIEDISLLIDHFRCAANARLGCNAPPFAPEVLNRMIERPWPGNVRQLGLAVHRLVSTLGNQRATVTDIDEVWRRRSGHSKPTIRQERHPRVFISYTHDSEAHKDFVLQLAQRFRADGIDCCLDRFVTSPPEGWPRWMAQEINEADFVILVCTDAYCRRFAGQEKAGAGLGAQWEGLFVTQTIYESAGKNENFIPVLVDGSQPDLPIWLRGATRYCLPSGYEALYRRLTNQPSIVPQQIGTLRTLPPMTPVGPRSPGAERSSPPQPQYENLATQALAERLASARSKRERLIIAGIPTAKLDAQILDLRRQIREGGRLKSGDCLGDGRFELLNRIGEGGFATVWRAYDRFAQRLVAVKVLHGQHSGDQNRRERFFRGARRMAELHHKNIVRVIQDQGAEDGFLFFVMEFVEGGDLQHAVRDGRITQPMAMQIIAKVGDALRYAHGQGLIHRDVKPANILLHSDSEPCLTDFDLVLARDTTGGTRTGPLGSFIFTAPEVLQRASDAQEAADVYSLAMTALFALSGKELGYDIVRNTTKFIAGLEIEPSLREALRRGTSWAVRRRFQTIEQFLDSFSERL